MSASTTPTPPPLLCKIKRIYPRLPLHVHSAVGQRLTAKDLGYRLGDLECSGAIGLTSTRGLLSRRLRAGDRQLKSPRGAHAPILASVESLGTGRASECSVSRLEAV